LRAAGDVSRDDAVLCSRRSCVRDSGDLDVCGTGNLHSLTPNWLTSNRQCFGVYLGGSGIEYPD
jgi:hypothetical protein